MKEMKVSNMKKEMKIESRVVERFEAKNTKLIMKVGELHHR